MAELRLIADRESGVNLRSSFPSTLPDASRRSVRLSLENQLPKLLIIEDEPEMIVALLDNSDFEGFEVARRHGRGGRSRKSAESASASLYFLTCLP